MNPLMYPLIRLVHTHPGSLHSRGPSSAGQGSFAGGGHGQEETECCSCHGQQNSSAVQGGPGGENNILAAKRTWQLREERMVGLQHEADWPGGGPEGRYWGRFQKCAQQYLQKVLDKLKVSP